MNICVPGAMILSIHSPEPRVKLGRGSAPETGRGAKPGKNLE
ncbi:hypothetical protein [Desulfurococcus amylolyticus]|nr:hypothetical protein [Desulfurococcus amylolyticus]